MDVSDFWLGGDILKKEETKVLAGNYMFKVNNSNTRTRC